MNIKNNKFWDKKIKDYNKLSNGIKLYGVVFKPFKEPIMNKIGKKIILTGYTYQDWKRQFAKGHLGIAYLFVFAEPKDQARKKVRIIIGEIDEK